MHYDEVEQIISMEMRTNRHTHPGSGGGGSTPPGGGNLSLINTEIKTNETEQTSIFLPSTAVEEGDIVYACTTTKRDSSGSVAPNPDQSGWTTLASVTTSSPPSTFKVFEHEVSGVSEPTNWSFSWTDAAEASLAIAVVRGSAIVAGTFGASGGYFRNNASGSINTIDMVDLTPSKEALMLWFSSRRGSSAEIVSFPEMLTKLEETTAPFSGNALFGYPGLAPASTLISPGILEFVLGAETNTIDTLVIACMEP